MKSLSLFVPLLVAVLVSAHGYVAEITIDSKRFPGNVPRGAKKPSIIRQISDISPVKGANNPSVNCGPNAQLATEVGNANPGSTISFDWKVPNGKWPHNTGPMLTYMASCGATPCNKFDSKKAKWFKIDQVGRKSNGKWFQEDLMQGKPANVKIPSNLAAGNYLIRHEIIALHLATQPGGAEFYPSCAQITVGGNQKGAPAASELVSLPGAYGDNDPGILARNVFNAKSTYVFPGPPVSKLTGSSGPAAAPAPATKPEPTGCKSKKPSSANAASATHRSQHVNRAMRGVVSDHSH
ncbi:glycosyl hydrolase family 61-domain-containing protein [Collybia nuda]|uniref:lytic cellulose monooxygenase (C4-dehydrogenating) n=1 Tax=Collybia nuda TaxID=64659 RepID=A0A9P5XXU0_9AGAR|nr:glycosyl hydrolase family 61-domain-containing protein [Collybia nuda]